MKMNPDIAIVDGNRSPGLECEERLIVNGDGRCRSIAAASVIAKVTRDRIMVVMDEIFPGYGFARVPIKVKKSWQKMVETYLSKRLNLKAVVVILDIRRTPTPGDMDLLTWLNHYDIHAIPVLTKTDKLSRQKARKQAEIGRASCRERV